MAASTVRCTPRSPEESPLHSQPQLLCCTVGGSSRALHQPCHTRVRVVASRVNLSEEQVSQLVVSSNNLDCSLGAVLQQSASRLLFAPRNERSAGPSNDLASSPRTRTSGSPSSMKSPCNLLSSDGRASPPKSHPRPPKPRTRPELHGSACPRYLILSLRSASTALLEVLLLS